MEKVFDVHVYPVVRIKIPDIEAASQMEAIKKAREEFSRACNIIGTDAEFAEEIAYYLVDEVGDEEFDNSNFIDEADFVKWTEETDA